VVRIPRKELLVTLLIGLGAVALGLACGVVGALIGVQITARASYRINHEIAERIRRDAAAMRERSADFDPRLHELALAHVGVEGRRSIIPDDATDDEAERFRRALESL
jgi:hypothetical protein